ncbi:MAG: 3-dehydroquinate synthase II [Candidatus Altiarchaeota archaeon]|nr:3-dehydroquinate synthase II [Candidatus Altiarchaeota archaeon]
MTKEVWVRADGSQPWDRRKKLITTALESGCSAVMVNSGEEEKARSLGRIAVVSEGQGADVRLGRNAFYKSIQNKVDEQEVVKLGRKAGYVVVNSLNWKVIPLENIIAALQGKCRIIVEVRNTEEARVALETLEVGSDGVLVNAGFSEIKKIKELVEEMTAEKIKLVPVKVASLKPVGMGDRVCVDTASMLKVGEGMLVGSQSNSMLLVHSESIETEYVASRPFRVNAGAVHAYVRMPDDKTKYLSELKAGEEVLAVNWKGNTRGVIVGRSKIEKRPLILVEGVVEGKRISTLLQNAETILLVRKNGKPVSISRLKPGDEVLGYVEDSGRHFGMKIKESIKEK